MCGTFWRVWPSAWIMLIPSYGCGFSGCGLKFREGAVCG